MRCGQLSQLSLLDEVERFNLKSDQEREIEGAERSHQAHAKRVEWAWRRAQRTGHRLVVTVFGYASRYASDTSSGYASDTSSRYASDTSSRDATSRAVELFRCTSLQSLLPSGEVVELGVSQESPLKRLWPDRSRVALSWSSARARLGSSEAALLVELDEGVQPDALAAALGVVVGGGIVLICAPALPPEQGTLKSQLTAWPHSMSAVTHHFWSGLWRSLRELPSSMEVAPDLWCSHITLSQEQALTPSQDLSQAPSQALSQAQVQDLTLRSPKSVEDPKSLKSPKSPKSPKREQGKHEQTYMSLRSETRRVIDELTLTAEQREAVLITLTALRREAFCAVSLCALRGRGKSSALGLVAITLLLEGEAEVVVTAPSRYAVEGLFARAQEALECLGEVMREGEGEVISARGVIRYHPPQSLWRREVNPRALLVDEAAALPVPLLERVLEGRPKIVFATTTQGYEGAGRGFSLRFRPLLQRRVRKLYEPKLTSPLRWGEGDPLEAWMMRALMLDVDVHLGSRDLDLSRYHHQEITRDELAVDQGLLREIFGLLVHAHYQTQPSDLWRILDAPQLTLHALRDSEPSPRHPRVIAVSLVSLEGGLTSERAAELYEGRVRARGQLFAANLSLHLDCEEGATLKLARVVRIAALPTQQGRGAGSRLLEEVAQMMRERGVDLIGSSFGSTDRLARFWLRARFTPLRVGVKQNHTSGERSLLVARALSDRGERTLERLAAEALTDLPHQLLGPLAQLDPELTRLILCSLYRRRCTRNERSADESYAESPAVSSVKSPSALSDSNSGSNSDSNHHLSDRAWRSLGAVIYGGRAYELALEPARLLTLIWLERIASRVGVEGHQGDDCGEGDQRHTSDEYQRHIKLKLTALGRLLVMKTLQRRRWLEVSAELNLSTSEAMRGLGVALELLFEQLAPPWALSWRERFGARSADQRLCAQLLPQSLIERSFDRD